MTAKLHRQSDGGFTLIELLVAVLILGILFTAISTAMIVSLDTLSGRQQAVTDTTGAQVLSAFLVPDAESADYVNPNQLAAGNANKFTCDDGTGTRVLLELRWTDANGTTGTTDVVYRVEPTSATDFRLVRYVYSVNVAAKTCSLSDTTVVAPAVKNDATFGSATYTGPLCDGTSTCSSTSSEVGLQIAAFSSDPANANGFGYAAYVFDVYGTRRLT